MTFILVTLALILLLWWGLFIFVHRWPRKPVDEHPDWGVRTDTFIPAVDGGYLEVWRVEPSGPSKGIVVLAHGWSRNRGRMVRRARLFGELGYTTILHSARDHGGSSKHLLMNAPRFGEDIMAVLDWVAEPVLLYGHSAGSAGAILAAHRRRDRIEALFLEGCYADSQTALMSLYTWVHPLFGKYGGPLIIATLKLLYGRNCLRDYSPEALAPDLEMPVMLIHGARDRRFPLTCARQLKDAFQTPEVEMFVAPGAGHSDSSRDPAYPDAIRSFVARWEASAA
jgi:pimeloyl-ACP methyl ester carboxylesterase